MLVFCSGVLIVLHHEEVSLMRLHFKRCFSHHWAKEASLKLASLKLPVHSWHVINLLYAINNLLKRKVNMWLGCLIWQESPFPDSTPKWRKEGRVSMPYKQHKNPFQYYKTLVVEMFELMLLFTEKFITHTSLYKYFQPSLLNRNTKASSVKLCLVS